MINDRQTDALRYLIFKSKDGTTISKQVLVFLVAKSRLFTQSVCMSLVADREGFTDDEIRDAAHGVDRMLSSVCNTHLGYVLDAMGTDFNFCIHYGDYDPNRHGDPFNCDGQFAGLAVKQVNDPGLVRENLPMRYTFWLATGVYSRKAKYVTATRADLEKIGPPD